MDPDTRPSVSAPAAHLAWLDKELDRWVAQGRIDAATATGIRGQYSASRRFSLARLLLVLGGAFVGVGLIWLVAANLEELSPLTRFLGITAVWLAAVAAGEVLDDRRDLPRDALLGTVRLIAALAFGAVVFQAAQSLQVPAYDSGLLGNWAAGALLYAYATAAVAPLLVGIVTLVGWFVWAVVEASESVRGVVLAFVVAAVLATAVAVVHDRGWRRRFAPPWRLAAALLVLIGLFIAAFPRLDADDDPVGTVVWVAAGIALVAAAAAAARADTRGRQEIGAAVLAAVLAGLLLEWRPPSRSAEELSGEALLRAVVAILVYLLAAAWIAALGVLRDGPGLTQLATAGLVLFTVVQSFAVFEPILSGAALFLVLGVILIGTGYLVERGRRRLVTEVTT